MLVQELQISNLVEEGMPWGGMGSSRGRIVSRDVLWLDSKAKPTCLWLHGRPLACTWQCLSPHWSG